MATVLWKIGDIQYAVEGHCPLQWFDPRGHAHRSAPRLHRLGELRPYKTGTRSETENRPLGKGDSRFDSPVGPGISVVATGCPQATPARSSAATRAP
jgi:hypothetical protein